MKQFKKVVASNGKYTDANGNEKNRYITVGRAFLRDDKSVASSSTRCQSALSSAGG